MLKIGNAQAFWGDRPLAAAQLLTQQPDLDYLTLDYLAEVSLSIMAIQQEKDPSLGYARDFIDVVESLIPLWKSGIRTKLVTNAGGLNPKELARVISERLNKAGLSKKIGVVMGDALQINGYVTANAYLGAQPIAESLEQGADIVITGRVADPSLVVGPAVYHHKWKWDDYDLLAGATVAGHLIECGTQITGGYNTNWLLVPDQATLGYPIAEIAKDGWCTITKPEQSGGLVSIETVKQQLLYEIGDPAHYLSPDVTVSFLDLKVEKECDNRIRVSEAKGKPPPNTYKVSATFRDGWRAEAMLAIFGESAVKKAKKCGQMILDRVAQQGWNIERSIVECLGAGDIVPGVWSNEKTQECVLRIAVADSRREALECFAKEVAPLITSGPQGITGYTTGRPKVRPVFGFKALSIPKEQIKPEVTTIK